MLSSQSLLLNAVYRLPDASRADGDAVVAAPNSTRWSKSLQVADSDCSFVEILHLVYAHDLG